MAETKDKKKELPWSAYSEAEKKELETLSKGYIEFLTKCKTERESVREIIRQAQAAGYEDLEEIVRSGRKIAPGAKVYCAYMKKAIALFHVGTEPLENGLAILGAHIDTCRLDVKQNPLYEDSGLAYLDTHYYGGIKKYQWVTVPLALHGVVVKKDGTVLDVVIGEAASEPTFCVTDLLVHLSQEQLKKSADKVVEGEKLDVLVGTLPLAGEEKEAVQKNVLRLLQEKYGIEEDDFLSAELSFVPAGAAREMGFDRSMILGYGQDDRVCSYTSLAAMLETKPSKRTACCLLVDKEEIGSVGATGMRSHFFENMLAELMNALGQYSELAVRRALASSKMLSSDVSSGYDALYAEAFDKRNVAYLGRGMVFNKFTGSRGKSGSNDANAEYLGELRAMLDARGVRYQSAELGKVDLGGGGTIAYIMALYGMQVIDSGVAVLSMHAPWEVTSKVDVYEVKKGYAAFLAEA
ncbi:aminopeptidase [Selenomonas sputigena]|uniref:M18 family aminopeptidase n=1 Tax=Selenomonas sputigena (strain ATCC 35185 / DSM 20758 / CCUG 44933 / VPI D19B-28) TaxID=546271 RepID=C9LU07_SELS3|nr:aminopeptidase [Selenomonas sputigena]AEC00359.1 peptidase M18 aminopeptidase I [Selenomonas sputigena ATCC 35185]EEX77538.1 aminopeptidase I zinc metalloprotease (M18) [Selenomonas sputigena ATCC 35185]